MDLTYFISHPGTRLVCWARTSRDRLHSCIICAFLIPDVPTRIQNELLPLLLLLLLPRRVIRVTNMRVLGERAVEPRAVVGRQRSPLAQPLHQVGVADKVAPKQQGVARAALQQAPAVGVVEAAGGQEGRAGPDVAERAQVHLGQPPRVEECLLLGLGKDLLVPRLDEAHVAEVRQRPLELARQVAPGLEALRAAGLVEQAERAEADRQLLLAAHGLGQRAHELEDKSAPPLGRAAVGVGACVDVAAQELLGQVAVAAVKLDAVEAALVDGPPGGAAVVGDCLPDLWHRHGDGRVVAQPDALRGVGRRVRKHLVRIVPGRRRGRQRRRARQVRDVGAPRVPQLCVDVTPLGVHGGHDLLPAGDLLGEEEARHARHGVALSSASVVCCGVLGGSHTSRCPYLEVRRDRLRDDKTALSSPLRVVLGHQVVGIPGSVGVLGRRVGIDGRATVSRQGRHDDAVLELDLAIGDGQGLEQLRVGLVDLPGVTHDVDVDSGRGLFLMDILDDVVDEEIASHSKRFNQRFLLPIQVTKSAEQRR